MPSCSAGSRREEEKSEDLRLRVMVERGARAAVVSEEEDEDGVVIAAAVVVVAAVVDRAGITGASLAGIGAGVGCLVRMMRAEQMQMNWDAIGNAKQLDGKSDSRVVRVCSQCVVSFVVVIGTQ